MESLELIVGLLARAFTIATLSVIALLLIASVKLVYNLFLHPLREYPGPKTWAASRLPYSYYDVNGVLHKQIKSFHERYGPVVRVAPDELSYITDTAWRTIYGQRPGRQEMRKARQLPVPDNGARSIVADLDPDEHKYHRKLLEASFTEKALREQESYVHQYANLLVQKLEGNAIKGPIDMVRWLNWTTFDMIGDLAFGDSFHSLDCSTNHPWVSLIFQMFKYIPVYFALDYYGLAHWVKQLTPRSRLGAYEELQKYSYEAIDKRIDREDKMERRDFVTPLLRGDEKGRKLTRDEIKSDAATLVVAGSETSATAISGILWYLSQNQETYITLRDELRTAFSSSADINMTSTNKLEYLHAVIQEGLRIYPPAIITFPRIVPQPGEMIDNQWVPGGTAVGCHHLSASHSSLNFTHASSFLPQRWLAQHTTDPSSEFYNDKRAASQPFLLGPRNCLGRNLAQAEMRILLAKLLWTFDMSLDESCIDWEDQKVYLVWEKKPLLVKLRSRHDI